jgi:dynein heavy chain
MGNADILMMFGGWSYNSQFANIMLYDIEGNKWVDPEVAHEVPKWNHSGIMAPAIPSWKYFIFGGSVGSFEEGGNRTGSRFVDDAYVLDVDSKKWQLV